MSHAHRTQVRALLVASSTALGLLLLSGPAAAADYYVAPAPTGSDSNPGTLAAPFATLQKGHDAAAAGDTVWLRGGKYATAKQIKLSKSGQSDTKRIKFWAYQGELPVIDFSSYVSTNTAADVPALLVTGSWLHLRGLEIANVPVGKSGDHSISAVRSEGASNNTFELLDIHHNFGSGLFISKGSGGNQILNCDSHDNYDKDGSQGDGQNADGFGVHYQESGPSTILRGCRAWLNSDDGYDLISQEVSVQIEGCWAIKNGYADGGSTLPASGNGNGFKAGSSTTGVRHLLQNDVAWKNRAAGFYANHSSGGNTWLNNTSYMNSVQYNMLASPPDDTSATIILTGDKVHKLRNNIGFPN
ncbi:MAG TPA: right-handed parallel beta-helix repeat-containing protein, partial [Polyangiaceae bacterium]|nr:right-handed parallel beta-helix repeat-containing protein [Polyangiaceae bacterium]